MKRPDIYVDQVDSDGFINILVRVKRGDFVYYAPDRIRLRVNNATEYRVARDIDEARQLRWEWFAAREAEGLKVKGVRSLDKETHYELNADRFSDPVPITGFEELARTYKRNKGFILLKKHKYLNWDVVFGEEFGLVTFGVIERAIRDGTMFEVFPRKDVPPI